jgi:hypothetical protein
VTRDRPVRKEDDLTAISDLSVQKAWLPRRLINLRPSRPITRMALILPNPADFNVIPNMLHISSCL